MRKLLFHIIATELLFANKALNVMTTDFEKIPANTVDELLAISEEAQEKFQQLLERGAPTEPKSYHWLEQP